MTCSQVASLIEPDANSKTKGDTRVVKVSYKVLNQHDEIRIRDA